MLALMARAVHDRCRDRRPGRHGRPVNAMDRAAFVQKFGGIFENSPWVAEQAWERRPFASLDDMHAAMVAVAEIRPGGPLQLTLLQSHPDLAGKEAQTGTMTASSVAEQAQRRGSTR